MGSREEEEELGRGRRRTEDEMPPMKTSRSKKGRESRRKRIDGSSIRSGGERLSLRSGGPRPRRASRRRLERLEPAGAKAKPGSFRVSGGRAGAGEHVGGAARDPGV